jgi:hypothetical protein
MLCQRPAHAGQMNPLGQRFLKQDTTTIQPLPSRLLFIIYQRPALRSPSFKQALFSVDSSLRDFLTISLPPMALFVYLESGKVNLRVPVFQTLLCQFDLADVFIFFSFFFPRPDVMKTVEAGNAGCSFVSRLFLRLETQALYQG